jgi:hypothetical protein
MNDDKKRRAVSISLRPDILALADATANKSQFFEQSVEACRGILELMNELRRGKAKRADVLEEIEDIVDAWGALSDETAPAT